MDWYRDLLTTKEAENKLEEQAEEVIGMVWRSMQAIANNQTPRTTSDEQVEEVIKNLNPKKAQDSTKWKNNIITEGGTEMALSLKKIVNEVDCQKEVPEE